MGDTLKAFWDKVSKNPYYKKIFKNPFTYVTGAVLLAVFQIAMFASTGSPWGVSGCTVSWAVMWISGITFLQKAHRTP